jgi:hypothetical protein
LTLQAINTKGSMNLQTISVVLESTDKEPPYLFREQSKVVATETGRVATLIFNDHLSAVVGGTIFVNGEKLTSFSGRLTNFTTSASAVDVEVKDAYDNVLKETVDLAGFNGVSASEREDN